MKKFKLRIRAFGIAVALVVGGLLAVGLATPSQAAPADNCTKGYTCMWRDHDYKTAGAASSKISFSLGISDLDGWYYSGFAKNKSYSANDSVTSVYNKGSELQSCYYKGSAYTGASFCLPKAGGTRNNLATSISPALFNDTITSARFVK